MLRADPTRTTLLRRQFVRAMDARFNNLRRAILQLVVAEDVFGLRISSPFSLNEHKYSSTQVNITDVAKDMVLGMVDRIDDDDLVGDGKEFKPHITVLYGLHAGTAVNVKKVLAKAGPIKARLLKTSVFAGDEYDVVKIDVQSPDLHRLHRRLAELPHTDTHPTYQPHLTLAYVKPGLGKRYVGMDDLEGKVLTFDTVAFSNKERVKTNIPVANTRWRYLNDDQKLEAFRLWLADQTRYHLFNEQQATAWFREYIVKGYAKGHERAFDDVRRNKAFQQKEDFYKGTRAEFLGSAFTRPQVVDKSRWLLQRTYTELQGVTEVMSRHIERELMDGLARGDSPRTVGAAIASKVDHIGKVRGAAIARTETIRAHAEGQLDAFEQLGVEELGVAVEFTTSGGYKVCPKCRKLQGMVLTIKQARGLIPVHPNCACAFVPANVGERSPNQVRNKARIARALMTRSRT